MNMRSTDKKMIRKKYDFFRKITVQKNLFTPAPTFAKKLPFQSGEFIRDTWKAFLSSPELPSNCSLYLHIPFCQNSRCHYCMYYSSILEDHTEIDPYISYLGAQADYFRSAFTDESFTSLYIGGGTPSILDTRQLSDLLSVTERFKFNSDAEKTCEQSFNTTSREKLNILARHGINRLSFGLQSVEEQVLENVNREPAGEEKIRELVKHAGESGVKEINIDLMIGLPGETDEGLKRGLLTAIDAGGDCVTVYVFRHLKHHMEQMSSREVFLTSYNTDHVPRMLNVLRKTVEEMGWIDTVMNDNSEFHFFTSPTHLDTYPLNGYNTRYNPEYQNSTLGLGHSAFSFIMDFFRHESRDREMTFDPKKKSFVFDRISGEERKRMFVSEHLNREGKVDMKLFKSSFGQEFERTFQRELNELKLLGKGHKEKDFYTFETGDRVEFAALSKFFWPQAYFSQDVSFKTGRMSA